MRIIEVQAGVGVVNSCRKCYTDVSLCLVDDLGRGRKVCVLTSWKDLGTGEGLDSPQWQSHLHKQSPSSGAHVRKVGQISGSVFEAYEKDTGQYRDGRRTWQAAPSKSRLESLLPVVEDQWKRLVNRSMSKLHDTDGIRELEQEQTGRTRRFSLWWGSPQEHPMNR